MTQCHWSVRASHRDTAWFQLQPDELTTPMSETDFLPALSPLWGLGAGAATAADNGSPQARELQGHLHSRDSRVELALTADDALRIKKEGKCVVYISIANASALASHPTLLTACYMVGVATCCGCRCSAALWVSPNAKTTAVRAARIVRPSIAAMHTRGRSGGPPARGDSSQVNATPAKFSERKLAGKEPDR